MNTYRKLLVSFSATLLVISCVSSSITHADTVLLKPMQTQGRIERFVYNHQGLAEALILDNHAVIKFAPMLLREDNPLKPGTTVNVTGHEILSEPNSVIDQAQVQIGDRILIGLDSSQKPLTQDPSSSKSFKTLTASSSLLAVSARPNGEVDRLFLKDGTDITLPKTSNFQTKEIHLGDLISVRGIGYVFPHGKFIEAMSIHDKEINLKSDVDSA